MDKFEILFIDSLQENSDSFKSNILNLKFKKLLEEIDEKNEEELSFNFLLKTCIYISDTISQNIDFGL